MRTMRRVLKGAHCTELMAYLLPSHPHNLAIGYKILITLAYLLLFATSATQASAATSQKTTEANPTDSAQTTIESPAIEKEPPLYQSQEERDMTLLASRQPAESIVWLDAMGIPFLSLYEQDLTGNPVGAVLIINAEGQHSSWPTTSERIRKSLPEFGWSTLSTELPSPEPLPIPARTLPADDQSTNPDTPSKDQIANDTKDTLPKASDQSNTAATPSSALTTDESATTTEMKLPAEDIAHARLQEAINYLHSKGQFNIVLMGNGIGAARAVCFLKSLPEINNSTQSRMIRALVLINARNRINGSDVQLQKCLNNPEMPVLDVYIGMDDRDKIEADERLKSSRHKSFNVYQQLQLPALAHNTMQGENRLSRRIRGFLNAHAKGFKIDKATVEKR